MLPDTPAVKVVKEALDRAVRGSQPAIK